MPRIVFMTCTLGIFMYLIVMLNCKIYLQLNILKSLVYLYFYNIFHFNFLHKLAFEQNIYSLKYFFKRHVFNNKMLQSLYHTKVLKYQKKITRPMYSSTTVSTYFSPKDHTVISWDWGYLSIPISNLILIPSPSRYLR